MSIQVPGPRRGRRIGSLALLGLLLAVLPGGGKADSSRPLLVQAENANPPGTTIEEIRQRYADQTGVSLTQWAPGMYALMYGQSQGRPTYYFCHDVLVTFASLIDGADIILFRKLVAEHAALFGEASYRLEGVVLGNGTEWASVDAMWTVKGRTLGLDLRQYSGMTPVIQLSVKDDNPCLSRAQLGW